MKALVYHGPGRLALEDRPKPAILQPTDAIVQIITTTICGTDLHIVKGDVPTIAETVPGYEASAFFGFGVPHGTPKEIVDVLNKQINLALKDPDMQAKLKDLGGSPVPGTPADFGKFLTAETAKWEKVVNAANLSVQ